MPIVTVKRALWILGNLGAAITLPALFGWWLRSQADPGSLMPGEAASMGLAIRAFAAAWIIFILAFNLTVAVFLWFRRSG
jgi:hypothetical protein